MVNETYTARTGEYTLTCDRCGHTASDPTIAFLYRWFNQQHKGCN
jgi:hypothetical protein